jgi:hypothetical protein
MEGPDAGDLEEALVIGIAAAPLSPTGRDAVRRMISVAARPISSAPCARRAVPLPAWCCRAVIPLRCGCI